MMRILLAMLWTSSLMVACYNLDTTTPGSVAMAIFFAACLGGLVVETANRQVTE